MKRELKKNYVVSAEEHLLMQLNADRYFEGNLSILIRKASISYTQGSDQHILIAPKKKSKK